MRLSNLRINAIASFLIIVTIIGFLMVIGRGILIPIVTSIFFSMVIYPLCHFFERYIRKRAISILITLILLTTLIFGLGWFLSRQFYPFFSQVDEILTLIPNTLQGVLNWLAQTFNLDIGTAKDWMANVSARILNFLVGSIPNPSILVTTLGLLPIYSFLFLLYRSSFKQFLLIQFSEEKRLAISRILGEILRLAQNYIYGLLIVVFILGLLNSSGLWLIGLPYPLFWGFLAALLTIIPYIGTFIGGTLPFLYALLHFATLWQPMAVVAVFLVIQQLEGNLITPKVVGSSVKINPLVAIISLFVFGTIWGVAGLILALPMVGIIRLIMSHIEPLKPFAMLLGNNLSTDNATFEGRFNDERYRVLRNFLYKQGK